MLKIVPSSSYDFGMPVASLVDVHSRGVDRAWMKKRASAMDAVVRGLKPDPDYAYIHLISLGAQEGYGPNRNGDGFNEKSADFRLPESKDPSKPVYRMGPGLIEKHATFNKDAYVFRHHKNSDPKYAVGEIVAETYNQPMKRGELIVKLPVKKFGWESRLQKLASGEDLAFSMATRVPFDICTICGNEAPSRAQYCKHASDHLGEITKEGHQVYVINDYPNFFDISEVVRPADRIAWSLKKVASDKLLTVGGAKLAEELGVELPYYAVNPDSPEAQAKYALARKLADIEKEIELSVHGVGTGPEIKHLISAVPCDNIPSDEMERLQDVELGAALKGLSSSHICLSLRDFIRLVTKSEEKAASEGVRKVAELLPGLFSRLIKSGEIEECVSDTTYDPGHTAVQRRVKEAVSRLNTLHSLCYGFTLKRAELAKVRGTESPRLAYRSKQASDAVPQNSARVAKEYAKYQLSFVKACSDSLCERLTVLGNYLS